MSDDSGPARNELSSQYSVTQFSVPSTEYRVPSTGYSYLISFIASNVP